LNGTCHVTEHFKPINTKLGFDGRRAIEILDCNEKAAKVI
jgi:hypothetical protein